MKTAMLWFAAVGALCVLLLLPDFAWSQVEATTGVISGTVRDPSGGVLPGVTIEVRNVETGLTRPYVTDQNGRYRAPLLPLGNYSITASLSGFSTLNRSGVRLGVGQELAIDLDMAVGEISETVQVIAESPIIELQRYERTQIINPRSIAELPINGRDFTDFVMLSPTASVTSSIQGKRIAVGSSSEVTTGITIDGADHKAPFRGLQTGATAPFILSQEAVQEFEVIRAGFSAEFGRSQGGRINVVTRSGTNQLQGSGFAFFRDSALAANDALGRELEFDGQQFGGGVGGPFIRDRLFFFTAYDQQYFSVPLFQLVPDELVAAADAIVPGLNLDAQRGRFTSTNDGLNWFWKTDYTISQRQQLSGRFNLLSAEAQNVFTTPNQAVGAQRAQVNDAYTTILTHHLVLGKKVNEVRFNYSRDKQPVIRHPLGTDFPTAVVNVRGQNTTIGGTGSDIDPFTQNRLQITNNYSHLMGQHDLKFGVDANFTWSDEFFALNARGQFTFLSLESFLARRPANFTQFVPLKGETLREAGTFHFEATELALYAQDKFRITPGLTINYGLRWEGQSNNDALTNPDFPLSGPIPDSWNNFAPRVGVTWDPFKQRKTAIRGGGGVFYSRSDTIATVRVFDTNATKGARITLTPTGPAGNLIPVFPNQFVSFDALPDSAIPPLDITFVDPDFELPRTVEGTVGIEHEIIPTVSVSADVIISRTRHGNRFRDINLFPAAATAPDGRPVYSRLVRPNMQFNRIQVIESTSRANYRGLTLALEKRFSRGVQLQGSYTYARARDDAGDSFNRVQGITVQDSFNLDGEFSRAQRDIRHRIVAHSVLELPWRFVISQIVSWQTGTPFNGRLANDANGDGVFTDRPFVNGRTVPFNAFQQPNFFNWDLRVIKRLKVPSGNMELSAEFFNLTNASNSTTTNTIIGRSGFGEPNVPGPPFQMQLGVRYRF